MAFLLKSGEQSARGAAAAESKNVKIMNMMKFFGSSRVDRGLLVEAVKSLRRPSPVGRRRGGERAKRAHGGLAG